uniref:Uncharacterized protein n=1 Tax=Ralstonia syzygii R24 TaxID=907261 RepID=G3A3Z9_9RALS|nr:hypothetical protein RALSY_30369 [Ralstonia syzygii R24]
MAQFAVSEFARRLLQAQRRFVSNKSFIQPEQLF